jgi:pilus assembly protein FimV
MNKMDLARAYQEMDDKDAARQILHEVIREGDVGQQERARLILGNL